MSIRSAVVVAVFWVFSLLAVGVVVHAQVWTNKFSEPRIISGADFGIRVEGERNGVLVGPLVVRVDGKWIEVEVGSATEKPHRLR